MSHANKEPSTVTHKIKRSSYTLTILILALVVLVLLAGILIGLYLTGHLRILAQESNKSNQALNAASTPTATSQELINTAPMQADSSPSPVIPVISPMINPSAAQAELGAQQPASLHTGILLLSLQEGNHYHLFAFHPYNLPLTRLTFGPFDDINPSLSPDNTQLAFASNRNGYWDLYLLDLASGQVQQVTNTPEYDGYPSWSPDGRWLVYESYPADAITGKANLDIFIRELNPENLISQVPIRLTDHPAADFSPAWSPNGRQIAYVSQRNGDNDIWLADLDRVDDRFTSLSARYQSIDDHPVWSPDGQTLLWCANVDGVTQLFTWQVGQPGLSPQSIASGAWAVWSADGSSIITLLNTPNHSFLSGFDLHNPDVSLPPVVLSGAFNGMAWLASALPQPLAQVFQAAAQVSPTPAWQPALTQLPELPGDRQRMVELPQISAPYPYLNDLVDESFQALRAQVGAKIGWDYLNTLENAFTPLTTPLMPGMLEDWLYTGRAVAVNPAALDAGWMVVVREEFAGQTFWRVYLRTLRQDGSQGIPLRQIPWDLSARSSGDPRFYEQGGGTSSNPPSGYWFDFTQMALDSGWERLPALSTWRMAYPAARYNEFVYRDGLNWYAAMLEIYPPEAVVTPTPPPPPSATPTKTPIPSQTPNPTQTVIPSQTPTPTLNTQSGRAQPDSARQW
jgi:TolB protein